MSKFNYSPRSYDDDCCKPVSSAEKEYPSMHVDIGPEQLKGLEAGDDIKIVITGKVKSLRYDTEDTWGTGASIGVSLRTCEIEDTQEASIIDSMIDGE